MNDDKLLNGFIKNLKLCNEFLSHVLPSKEQESSVKHYEVVDDSKRHVYEKNSQCNNDIFEAMTKLGTKSTDNNCFDSFVIMSHPKDDRFKLMVVADGEGFVADPKTKKIISSSKRVTNEIGDWFSTLGEDELNKFSVSNFVDDLNRRMEKLHSQFKALRGNHGTKVIMALVGNEYTFIANLGDLRCYIEKDSNIVQFNEEDSLLWEQYRNGYFWDKEEFRFRKSKDINVSKLGVNQATFTSSYLLDNDCYNRIYLFSRGVIDCLSEDKLTLINEDIPTNRVIDAIITVATDGEKEHMSFYEGNPKEIMAIEHGEKDATACVYMKKRK